MAKNQELIKIIEEIRYREKINQSAIASKLGVDSHYLSDVKNGRFPFTDELRQKIYGLFPYVKNEANAVEVSPDIRTGIPLVSQYAYAGYLSGFGDPDYIETLPMVDFIPDREMTGNWVAFEVRGDSMDDGTKHGYEQGEIVICREVEPYLYKDSKLHYNQRDFVIVHEEGILLKRVIDHDVENHTIVIHSLNPIYPDRVLNLSQVRQIFSVVESRIQRKR